MQSLSQLADELQPYLPSGVGGSSNGAGLGIHALDSPLHAGFLGDNQAPQFLKLDGTRPMTGSLNLGNNNITNVGLINGIDITNLAAGASGQLIEGFGIDITGSGFIANTPVISIDPNAIITGLAGKGIKNDGDKYSIDFGPGFAFNGSEQLILAPTIGGNGLIYNTTGGVMSIFNGLGLEFNANGSLQIDFDGIAGNGLGANLNDLFVKPGTHVSTATDEVSVTVGTMAGDGLGVSGEQLIVNAGDAIEIFNDEVRVRAADLVGEGLNSVGNNLNVRAGFTTKIENNALEVDTAHNFAWTGIHTHSANLASAGAVSGVTGYTLFPDGTADFRDIQADTLTVDAFVSDVNLALAGSEILTKSGATLSRTFTTPTTSGTFHVFDHIADTQVFEDGDSLAFRYMNRGTGLEVGWFHGQVSGYTDLPDGEQSWTVTRVSGSVGVEIPAGTWVIDYGTAGDGVILSTVNDLQSPYIDIRTWAGVAHLPSSFTTHLRLGKLDGVSDTNLAPSGFGLYSDNAYLRGELVLGNGEVILDEGGLSMGGFYQPPNTPNTPEKITYYTNIGDRTPENTVAVFEGYRNDLIVNSAPIQTNFANIRAAAGYQFGNSTGADIAQIAIRADWFDQAGGADADDSASLILNGKQGDSDAFLRAREVVLGGLFGGSGSNVIVDGVGLYPSVDLYADLGLPTKRWRRIYADELVVGTTSSTDTGHNHDTRYYLRSEVDGLLSGKADTIHTHAGYATQTYVDGELLGKIDVGTTFDDRYYTETEIDGLIGNLSANGHTHNDIYYTETEVDAIVGAKADTGHTHNFSTVTDHSDLANILPDQHHNQQHAIDGPDHTGNLPWNRVDLAGATLGDLGGTVSWANVDKSGAVLGDLGGTLAWANLGLAGSSLAAIGGDLPWDRVTKTGSSLSDLETRPHGGLTAIGTDDHHAKQHPLSDLTHHTGVLSDAQFPNAYLIDGSRSITGNLLNDGGIDQDIGAILAPWRNLHVVEILATRLVTQDTSTSIDGRLIVPTFSGRLTRDVLDSDTTIYMDTDNGKNGGYAYMQKVKGGLPQFEVVQLVSDATTVVANEEYSYTVVRYLDSPAENEVIAGLRRIGINHGLSFDAGLNTSLAAAPTISWEAGDGVVSLGKDIGDGFIDISATNSILGSSGPTISINSRSATAEWNDISEVVALGNLENRLDYTEPTFGFAVGNNLNSSIETFQGMTATKDEVRLVNTPVEHYYNNGGVQTQGGFFGSDGGNVQMKLGPDTSAIGQGNFSQGYAFQGEGLLIQDNNNQSGYTMWFGGSGSSDTYLQAGKGGALVKGQFAAGGISFDTGIFERGAIVQKDSEIRFESETASFANAPYKIHEINPTAGSYVLAIESDDTVSGVEGIRLAHGDTSLGVGASGVGITNGALTVQREALSTRAGLFVTAFEESEPAINIADRVQLWGNRDKVNLTLDSTDTGSNSAPHVNIGYNSNTAAPTAGFMRLYSLEGQAYYFWVDSNGVPRFDSVEPTAERDTIGQEFAFV